MCRCEEVTRAEVDSAIEHGARDMQALKLSCRLGMGSCQGRQCASNAAQYLSKKTDQSQDQLGRVNPRPPVRPVTLGALANMKHHKISGISST